MNFITHNEDDAINVNGTSFQGYLNIDYQKLVDIFGEPTEGDGDKVDAEWVIKFGDATVATIYNYKDGKNYLGSRGKSTKNITDWHIGGFDTSAYEKVEATIAKHRK